MGNKPGVPLEGMLKSGTSRPWKERQQETGEHPRSTPYPGRFASTKGYTVYDCRQHCYNDTISQWLSDAGSSWGGGGAQRSSSDERAAGVRFIMLEVSCLDRGGGDVNSKR